MQVGAGFEKVWIQLDRLAIGRYGLLPPSQPVQHHAPQAMGPGHAWRALDGTIALGQGRIKAVVAPEAFGGVEMASRRSGRRQVYLWQLSRDRFDTFAPYDGHGTRSFPCFLPPV